MARDSAKAHWMLMSGDETPPNGPARRQFLRGAGLLTGGLAVGGTVGAIVGDRGANNGAAADSRAQATVSTAQQAATQPGQSSSTFHGSHQAGITDHPPAHLRFVALDLAPATLAGKKPAIAELQKALSDAASSMTSGNWITPQGLVAQGLDARGLTVTFGFGPRLIRAAGEQLPGPLAPIPAFPTDELDPARTGGDLGIQICAPDELLAFSVAQALVELAAPAAQPRWMQSGFLPGANAQDPNGTPRNLMGQLDGTDNPVGSRLELAIWVSGNVGPSWMAGGTYLVCRRIRMLLADWHKLAVPAREAVIGRRLDSGAPLSGGTEHSTPSFSALGADGRPIIARNAHLRLTHPATNAGSTMLRRGYSYDEGLRADGTAQAGLFFQAFQTDPRSVFVPIQQRLAATDALSPFIRHEGSALFAVPPGAPQGSWVGQGLLG
jgi:dye decolorizing peroxidase